MRPPFSFDPAYYYAGLTIIFWSTVATAFKLSLAYIHFLPLVFYASLVSLLVLAILCLVQGKFAQLLQWEKPDYVRSLYLGVLNPGVYYLLLFKAYELLPAQEAQVLNFAWPVVLVVFGAIFLGQQLTWISSLAILFSFAGVILIATHGDISNLRFSQPLGVSLALVSTVVWAAYWVISQTDKRDPLLRLLVNFIVGVMGLALLMTFEHQWGFPTSTAIFGIIYIGLFEMSLAFFCWFQALRLTSNISMVSNLIFLVPFLSLVFISHVLDETITVTTLWGLSLILGGIIIQRVFIDGGNKTS